MKVVPLFQHDDRGMAIPILNPESTWVLEKHGLLTIKLDGIQVVVKDGKPYRWWPKQPDPDAALCALDPNTFPAEDGPLVAAFNNAKAAAPGGVMQDGIYEAFGPGIKGNPMACEEPFMLSISPMRASGLIVTHGSSKVKQNSGCTPAELFDSIKAELLESSEIEGFVFLLEETITKPLAWASATKVEFGIPWPTNVLVTA